MGIRVCDIQERFEIKNFGVGQLTIKIREIT